MAGSGAGLERIAIDSDEISKRGANQPCNDALGTITRQNDALVGKASCVCSP